MNECPNNWKILLNIELIKNTDKPTKDTTIIVNNYAFFSKSMTKGELGVAESYMDGDWDTPDLEKTLNNVFFSFQN